MTRRVPHARRLYRVIDMARSAAAGVALAGGLLALCWAAGLASVP